MILFVLGYPVVAVMMAILTITLFKAMIRAGWRWRVRDGNRLPWEMGVHADETSDAAIGLVGYRQLWVMLSVQGRRRFAFRCSEFGLFVVLAAIIGFSSGVLLGVVFTGGALAATSWFLRWVRRLVAASGPGANPWANS